MSSGEIALQPLVDSEIEQRFEQIQAAIDAYDPSSPQASHLRQHQEEAIAAFRNSVTELSVDDFAAGMGIGLIMPTGSGKTVIAAEVMRMLKAGVGSDDIALRALMLMPRKSIRNQTIGSDEQQGIQQFAPELTVASSVKARPDDPADVTLALYQGVTGLSNRGFLKVLNPTTVVCDEMQHVIDGSWARHITNLAPGRLLVGLTATPEYSPKRHVGDIFPITAIRRTMRDGIEAGYLSDLEGHIYRGKSRIELGRSRNEDYDPAAVFDALINSEDNYTAAKIVAQEVAKGRRGIVFCAKGYDRAHSKLMAKIISAIEIDTPTGRRHVRAVHVDGDTPEKVFENYRTAMLNNEIDVFTNVDFLLEGTDIPVLEFAFIHRPTASKVMAEQRLGRILRFLPDKLATVHEFVYEFVKGSSPQITHADILQSERAVVGRSIKPPKAAPKPAARRKFNSDDFTIDEEHLARLDSLDAVPIEEIKISCGQKVVPYDWKSEQLLALSFGTDEKTIKQALVEAGVLSRTEVHDSGERIYYPPRAVDILVEKLDIPDAEEGTMTLSDILTIAHASPLHRQLSRTALKRHLSEEGYTSRVCRLPDGRIIHGYPKESVEEFLPRKVDWRAPRPPRRLKQSAPRRAAPSGTTKSRRSATPRTKQPKEAGSRNEREITEDEIQEIVTWCKGILIHPDAAPFREREYVIKSLDNLSVALRLKSIVEVPPSFKRIVAKCESLEINGVMRELIEKQKIDLPTLLFFAQRARRSTEVNTRRN